MSGTLSFTGSPCFSTASVDLVVARDHVSGTASAGEIRADLTASWTDNHIAGTFTLDAGPCGTGSGTFKLDR